MLANQAAGRIYMRFTAFRLPQPWLPRPPSCNVHDSASYLVQPRANVHLDDRALTVTKTSDEHVFNKFHFGSSFISLSFSPFPYSFLTGFVFPPIDFEYFAEFKEAPPKGEVSEKANTLRTRGTYTLQRIRRPRYTRNFPREIPVS